MSDDDNKRELTEILPVETKINFDSVFPKLSGWFTHRRNKRRAMLLANARRVLKRFFADDEEVVYVSAATRNFFWEMFFVGWIAYYVNTTTLVVTNKRVLTIHADRSGKPKSYANQIAREAIKKARAGWLFGSLRFKLGRGMASYIRLPRREARAMAKMLPPNPQATRGQEYLCPSCGLESTDHGWPCTRCGADALSPRAAAVKSMVLPGLGDWMLGHRFPAVLEMMGSAIGWLIVGSLTVLALVGGEGAPDFSVIAVWLGLITIGHTIDAAVTHAQARKGLYSVDGALPTNAKPLTPVPTSVGGTTTPTAAH